MNRLRTMPVVLVVCCVCIEIANAFAGGTERPPDIVVYLADDLSTADLSVYGGTDIKTPAIAQLASEGMTFNRAFVASPSCAVSRAALLTGLMPARNGAEENHTYPRQELLKLPQVLSELGYQTAAFGKVAQGEADVHRDRIFTTHSGDRMMNVYLSRSIRTDRHKLIWNPHPEFAFTTHIDLLVRKTSGDYFKQWRELAKTDAKAARVLAKHHGRPEFELFDLEADSKELTNLSGDENLADVQSKLLAELKAWIKDQGDELTVFHEPLMLDAPKRGRHAMEQSGEKNKVWAVWALAQCNGTYFTITILLHSSK